MLTLKAEGGCFNGPGGLGLIERVCVFGEFTNLFDVKTLGAAARIERNAAFLVGISFRGSD